MYAFLIAFLLLLIPRPGMSAPLDILDDETEWMKTMVCPYVLITIPGSGSHLVIKALFHLNNSLHRWHFYQPNSLIFSFSKNTLYPTYLCTHFWVHPLTKSLHEALQLKKIVCIRDPRDVCIAALYKMREGCWPGFTEGHEEVKAAFQNLSFDEQLHFVINYEYEPAEIGQIRQLSFSKVFSQAIEYINDPEVLVIRYENLVGEKGNGSHAAQLKELRRLSEFIHLTTTDERLEEISAILYGNYGHNPAERRLKLIDPQVTFRKGKKGSWVEAFKEEHKEAFKKKFGDVVVQMGYEENNDW